MAMGRVKIETQRKCHIPTSRIKASFRREAGNIIYNIDYLKINYYIAESESDKRGIRTSNSDVAQRDFVFDVTLMDMDVNIIIL